MVSVVDNNTSVDGGVVKQQQQQHVGSAGSATVSGAAESLQQQQNNGGSMSQSIGREFARQYYTMLANAPKYMHRFYGTKSVFVRNDEVVTGQTNIESHIAALNLKDCHTKILLVDARDTIDRGVVVQIIGEISINNGPWKNFVQTFVLASQTEKKYYVHNDTFYYLDDILTDKHLPNVDRADHVSDKSDKPGLINDAQNVINGTLHGEESCADANKIDASYAVRSQAINQRGDVDLTSTTTTLNVQQELAVSMAVDGGGGAWVQPAIATSQVDYHGQQHAPLVHQQVSMAGEPVGEVQYGNVVCQVGGCKEGVPSVVAVEEFDESMPTDMVNKSSWASVAASGKFPGHPQQMIPFHVQSQRPLAIGQITMPVVSGLVSFTSDNSKLTTIPPTAGLKSPEAVRGDITSTVAVSSNSNVPYGHALGRGPVGTYQRYKTTDQQQQQQTCEMQVYVRNLPDNTKEEELKDAFSKFGTITKVSIVNRHPYPFAFVTFDNPESVKRVFENNQQSHCIRGNHRLIVEKKRNDTENGSHSRYPQQRYDRDGMAGGRVGSFRNGSGVSSRGGGNAGPFRGSQVRGGGRPGANFYNTNRTAYMTNQPPFSGPIPPPMIK